MTHVNLAELLVDRRMKVSSSEDGLQSTEKESVAADGVEGPRLEVGHKLKFIFEFDDSEPTLAERVRELNAKNEAKRGN